MEHPLAGLPRKEQRRLGRLASSGQRMTDPEDARLVQELVTWDSRVTRRVLVFQLGTLAFFPVTGALWTVAGLDVMWRLMALSVTALGFTILLFLLARRRLRRISRANGWPV